MPPSLLLIYVVSASFVPVLRPFTIFSAIVLKTCTYPPYYQRGNRNGDNIDVCNSNSNGNSQTGARCETIALSIVPVKVKGRGKGRIIETYALLDNGSTATFCTEQLLEDFGFMIINVSYHWPQLKMKIPNQRVWLPVWKSWIWRIM